MNFPYFPVSIHTQKSVYYRIIPSTGTVTWAEDFRPMQALSFLTGTSMPQRRKLFIFKSIKNREMLNRTISTGTGTGL